MRPIRELKQEWRYSVLPLVTVRRASVFRIRLLLWVGILSVLAAGVAVPIWVRPMLAKLQLNEARFFREVTLPANRGRILDRNGQTLATDSENLKVSVNPKVLDADQRNALASQVGVSPVELARQLANASSSLEIASGLASERWQQVRALNIPGVTTTKEKGRKYPEGEAATHVVGFVNSDSIGQEGVELGFQKDLQGTPGSRTEVRGMLASLFKGAEIEPRSGADVHLSIDAKVQFFAYQRVRDAVAEHKAKAGSVVVLDVETGEVLAMANYPSYDPGKRSNLSGGQLRNRAVTDIFEPGSTMKPFIAALSLEMGRVKADTQIHTAPGSLVVSGVTIRDSLPNTSLTVAEAIQKSSNTAAVRMAMQFQPRELWEFFTHVGFGQKPQISFPGTVTGRLRPYKSWRPIEQATMAYGYGLSASLLQVALAYTLFSNDGEVIPISMLRQEFRSPGVHVVSKETAREVRKMLREAAGPKGASPLAQTIGYSVGGMSGTANKQEGKGYATNKYRSWFVGLAPIDKPRIVVAVMLDEPSNGVYNGALVAAPVFSNVAQQTLRTLGVQPDLKIN